MLANLLEHAEKLEGVVLPCTLMPPEDLLFFEKIGKCVFINHCWNAILNFSPSYELKL